jgi:hypothetical protein
MVGVWTITSEVVPQAVEQSATKMQTVLVNILNMSFLIYWFLFA